MPSVDGRGWSDLNVLVTYLLKPLQKPDAQQSWEKLADGGYIFRAERADPLTHVVDKIAVQFADASAHQAQQCGPRRIGVSRMVVNGNEAQGWDLINLVPNIIAQSVQDEQAQSATPVAHPPPGTPAPALHAPITHYGQVPGPAPSQDTARSTSPAAQSAPRASDDAFLSPAYNSCMKSGDAAGGVTSAILDCAGAETARQDARLNQAYKAKMAALPPDQQQGLRASERDWIKSRDATCKAAMGDEAEGTLGAVIYAQCILKQEAARATQLATGK